MYNAKTGKKEKHVEDKVQELLTLHGIEYAVALKGADDTVLMAAFKRRIETMPAGFPTIWLKRLKTDPKEAITPTICPDRIMWDIMIEKWGVKDTVLMTTSIIEGIFI